MVLLYAVLENIVQDFRDGTADVMLAAKSLTNNVGWEPLGEPIDVRHYKYSNLLMKRGDVAVA